MLKLDVIGKINSFRSRPLVKDTVITTFFSTIGKAVGFLIPFFIAAWFGVTGETDAFFFAYGLILFFSMIFAPVVERVIVPYIAEARSQNGDVEKFVGRILGVSGIGLLALTGILLLIIKPVLSVMTRFDAQGLDLVYWILIETSPLIIFLVWTSILTGTLNAYKRFIPAALSPAIRAVFNLGIIFIFKDKWGVHAIALGYVVGEIVRFIILAVVIQQLNLFKFRLVFQCDSRLKEFLRTASYQTIGMAGVGLNPIIDQTMASWLGKGSVSVLHYADRLYMIPVTFMTAGLMVTLLSHWSGRYYESGPQRLKGDVKKAVKIAGFITLPIMLVLIIFHQPIVNLAFGRGAFDQERLPEVGWVWVCYLLGFLPYTIKQVYVQGHLVLKNTKDLLKCAFWLIFLNILLNYILMKPFKTAGIAIATTLTSAFSLFYLSSRFYRRLDREEVKS